MAKLSKDGKEKPHQKAKRKKVESLVFEEVVIREPEHVEVMRQSLLSYGFEKMNEAFKRFKMIFQGIAERLRV